MTDARPAPWSVGETGLALALGAGLLAASLRFAPIVGLWGRPALAALALYGVIALLVLAGARRHGLRRFGPANCVTLLRGAATAFLAGLGVLETPLPLSLRGVAIGLALAGLVLDGIDGWAARRTGLASPFGARFDMEVDALSILVITWLLFQSGQVEPWVLTIGLARYIFVAAGLVWPPLAQPLPPSLTRKTICVATVVALLLALAPMVGPGPARMICAAALVMLLYSFAVDCIWLVRHRRLASAARSCGRSLRPFTAGRG